jgi:hypothetical protein
VRIAGAERLQKAYVSSFEVSVEVVAGLPLLAGVERGGEIVGAERDDDDLRLPGDPL